MILYRLERKMQTLLLAEEDRWDYNPSIDGTANKKVRLKYLLSTHMWLEQGTVCVRTCERVDEWLGPYE